MNATKVAIAGVIAILALVGIVFAASALFAQESLAESFDWQSYGYASGAGYKLVSTSADYSSFSGEGKGLVVRIAVPAGTANDQVKLALVDAVRNEALRDRTVSAITAIAYNDGEKMFSDEYYSGGKAIWGPGGSYRVSQDNQEYAISFMSAHKYVAPKPTLANEKKKSRRSKKGGGSLNNYISSSCGSSSGGG
jgi:hypothetical protein